MQEKPALNYTINHQKISVTLTSIHHTLLDQTTNAIRKAQDDVTYSSLYASVRCPFDFIMQKQLIARATEIGTIDHCVVIGIGGSSLGFRAIYDALQDHAALKKDQICILETVDSAATISALHSIDSALKKQLRVHVAVISKSGTTTETIALWRVVQPLLETYNLPDWHTRVTIITDTGSPLEAYAHAHTINVLTIPPLVGGRYSVFSPVGLLPLALCGISFDVLLHGARDAVNALQTQQLHTMMPVRHAIAILSAYHHNYQVHDTFIFNTWCATIGLWYRQLSAESLGKIDIHGEKIVSMIPTVSVGSTDLHAIGQLYLSGARNFWTTFITITEQSTVKTPVDNFLDACVPYLNDRSFSEIMIAIETGTMQAYTDGNIPHSHIILSARSPYVIGYLMQSYMLAIMYAAALLEVNPFDQPDVERYKKITRQLLSRPKIE